MGVFADLVHLALTCRGAIALLLQFDPTQHLQDGPITACASYSFELLLNGRSALQTARGHYEPIMTRSGLQIGKVNENYPRNSYRVT
ncbi:hypothetical protein F5141DRAFT_749710 [Pisolithus sp. B1]|nr:hypothetical protein F5141DRAFT_749710 [Pisolithus sp. B1]